MHPHFLPRAGWLLSLAVLVTPALPVRAATLASPKPPPATRLTGTFDGIEFDYSPGQEPLARLLAKRFAEHNREERRRAPAAAPATPEPLSVEDLRANRAKYVGHIAALLALQAPTPLQEECYGEFLRNYAKTMAEYDVLRKMARKMAVVRRVTLWDRAELVRQLQAGRQIPGFTWDPVTKQGRVNVGFSGTFQDPRLAKLAARRRKLHLAYRLRVESHGGTTTYRAQVSTQPFKKSSLQPASSKTTTKATQMDQLPVIIPANLAGKPAAEQAKAMLSTGSMIANVFHNVDAFPSRIPTNDPHLAYLILHETTEIGIIDRYMRGPDRRWFCDGVANYAAWRVVRDLDGPAAAKRVYNLSGQLARYAPLRTEADLRRWPAVEDQSETDRESALNSARYAYATNAVMLMNERAGEDILPRLFADIGRTKPEDTSILTVAKAWRKLTGTPLMAIVDAAVGETPKPGEPAPDDSQLDLLGAHPSPANTNPGFDYLCRFWRRSSRIRYVKVTRVVPGGPSARAGLRPGDRIVAVDGRRIPGTLIGKLKQTLSFHLAPDHPTIIRLSIERGFFHRKRELRLTFDPPPAKP